MNCLIIFLLAFLLFFMLNSNIINTLFDKSEMSTISTDKKIMDLEEKYENLKSKFLEIEKIAVYLSEDKENDLLKYDKALCDFKDYESKQDKQIEEIVNNINNNRETLNTIKEILIKN